MYSQRQIVPVSRLCPHSTGLADIVSEYETTLHRRDHPDVWGIAIRPPGSGSVNRQCLGAASNSHIQSQAHGVRGTISIHV